MLMLPMLHYTIHSANQMKHMQNINKYQNHAKATAKEEVIDVNWPHSFG